MVIIAAAFLGAAGLLYSPGFAAGLLSDDFVLLESAASGVLIPRGWYMRPLPLGIWWGLSQVTDEPSLLMHLVNTALHGLNAAMVALLARRLGIAVIPTILAGLLFLAYPAAVEPVVWCSGLQDVLLTTATLGFVNTWIVAPPNTARLTLMLLFFLAGLATKETAIMMPALGFVAAWPTDSEQRRQHCGVAALFGTLAGLFALWRLGLRSAGENPNWSLSTHQWQSLLFRPFGALGAPWSSDLLALAPWLLGLSVGGAAFLIFAASLRWSHGDIPGWATALQMVLWIPLAVAPTYGFFFVAPDLQGSRYAYLPAVGGAILLAHMLSTAVGRDRFRLPILLAVSIVVLGTSVGAVRFHTTAWTEAATLRDRVVALAVRTTRSRGCASVAFAGLPDNWRGAFVFRNGFDAAMRRMAPDVAEGLRPSERAACRFDFDGRAFVEHRAVSALDESLVK